jgi:hypothetical protein
MRILIIIGIILVFSDVNGLTDEDVILDLSGMWRFRTGDHITWRNTGYNDEKWDTITVPATWEAEGHDHRGYAWYRKTFTLPEEYVGVPLCLIAGKIGDADQTYINGQLIGTTGKFPPDPQSERNLLRRYKIPEELLRYENVVAIRVYNLEEGGGLYESPIGIIQRN